MNNNVERCKITGRYTTWNNKNNTANNKSYPPPSDQSFWARSLVGANFCNSAVQNQPLIWRGCRSGLSQPLKSQRRPEVQMYLTLSRREAFHINIFKFFISTIHARSNCRVEQYFERCGSWWIRSRRRSPVKLDPCNVVGRNFYPIASPLPVQPFLDQPMKNNSLFHWIVDGWFLRDKPQLEDRVN